MGRPAQLGFGLIIVFLIWFNLTQNWDTGRIVHERHASRTFPQQRHTALDLDLDGIPDAEATPTTDKPPLHPSRTHIQEATPSGCGDAGTAKLLMDTASRDCGSTMAKRAPSASCAPHGVSAGRAQRLHRLAGDWPVGCQGAGQDASACALAKAAGAPSRELILTVVSESPVEVHALPAMATAATRVGLSGRVVVAPLGCRGKTVAQASGLHVYDGPALAAPGSGPEGVGALAARWAVTAAFLSTGTAVLLLSPAVVLVADPLALFARDSDIEAMSSGWAEPEVYGYVHGTDDPSMGWSRYVESMRMMALEPAFMLLQATNASLALARVISGRLDAEGDALMAWAQRESRPRPAAAVERRVVNEELVLPAANSNNRVGARFRVLDFHCFLSAAATVRLSDLIPRSAPVVAAEVVSPWPSPEGPDASLQRQWMCDVFVAATAGEPLPSARWRQSWASHEGLRELERTRTDLAMQSRAFESWADLASKPQGKACEPVPPRNAQTQPLNHIAAAGPGVAWPVHCDGLEALCATLRSAASAARPEVLAAVSNKNILPMLGAFIDGLHAAGVSQFVLVALDERTQDFGKEKGVHTYLREVKARGGSTDNHATSGLKFRILKEFITVRPACDHAHGRPWSSRGPRTRFLTGRVQRAAVRRGHYLHGGPLSIPL